MTFETKSVEECSDLTDDILLHEIHYLMDETYLPKKLNYVGAVRKIPKDVTSAIMRINDVRNAPGHGFFPENRRRYWTEKKVIYNGVDIFSKKGVEKFNDDFEMTNSYLFKRAFGENI